MESNTLESRLDAFAEAWRPKAGDKLVGTVVELGERYSDYSEEPYPIVTVRTEDGTELAFHAFHTVARRELAKLRPEIGETIGIAYHGRHEKGYERYRIIVERESVAPPDWDRIGRIAEAEDEAEQPELAADTSGLDEQSTGDNAIPF